MELSLDPGVLVGIAVTEGLYLRALSRLRGRGVRVPRLQIAAFHGAIALWLIGLVSPLDGYEDTLLSAHMAQHVLIADLAAPLLLMGIRNPVLAFYLPRSALVTLARTGWVRRGWRTLRKPLVAIAFSVTIFYAWHLGPLFEAAVRHPVLHALQHMSLIAAATVVWWPALEPKRRRVPGDLWKVPYVLGARFATMFLGMSLVVVRVPVYTGVYGTGERHGLTALADQQAAAGIMISVDILVMVAALCFFFARASGDAMRADDAERAAREAALLT
ncbi:MAG: cytochrome c oxidase assembly protein [Gemmatimonadales bacterium]